MYRQRTVETETEEKFVSRLYDLPVVTSAVGKLSAFYTGTKEHNRLFRFTLETTETSLGLVLNTAKPVVAKFEKPIGTLNGLACHQLEKLEHDYPIITKPTDIVLRQTLERCQSAVRPITERIKPFTTCVGSATQFGATKINDAKVFTLDTVDGVKSYSIKTVNGFTTSGMDKLVAVKDLGSRQVSRILSNQTGRAIVARVDMVIDLADCYVDKYLPEEEEALKDSKALSKAKKSDPENQHVVVMNKAVQLGYKVRRRAYNHAAKKLKVLKMRSLETVDKLHFTVDLIEYGHSHVDGAKNKVQFIWEEINKSPEEVSKEITENEHNVKNLTYERRAIATARHLTQKFKAGLSASVEMIPTPVRVQIDKAIELAQSLLQTFTLRAKTGLTENDINNVKKSIGQLKTSITSLTPNLQMLQPLGFNTVNDSHRDLRDGSPTRTKNDESHRTNHNLIQDGGHEDHSD